MLLSLLRRAADEAPERPLLVASKGTVTYGEALARSEGLTRGLEARPAERLGCTVTDPSEVLALLAACAGVGVEPCVYPRDIPPDVASQLASELGHRLIVTDEGAARGDAQTVAVDDLFIAEGPLPPPNEHAPVLILTTGTTGRPKGIRHDWATLVAAQRPASGGPEERVLLTYNLNQFAGVQVLLHALARGVTLVVPPSNQPREAIATMREERVTHVSATPTFWRLIAGMLDESSARQLALRQITLGGEAPTERLLERLGRLFPNARISQIYGATEFGTVVSVRDRRSGLPVSVLERDESAPVQMRIVEGELQVRSPHAMAGYHGGGEPPAGWWPTGDLVEVRGNRIHFVGRTSDVINVGGVKVSPLPIEELVASVDGVLLARVYGRANPVTGQVVALDVVPEKASETSSLEARIRAACEPLAPAARPRRIRFVPDLETRGQKVVRTAGAARP